jgi:ATP-dependent DNA ligase
MECDLEIIAVEEGTGKYAGKLGAVVCATRSEDGKRLTVSVGSGFNDAHRDNLWSIRDSLIGKIVAVKYNMRIKNKVGEESLFLPIFVEVRDDKDVADSIGDIK